MNYEAIQHEQEIEGQMLQHQIEDVQARGRGRGAHAPAQPQTYPPEPQYQTSPPPSHEAIIHEPEYQTSPRHAAPDVITFQQTPLQTVTNVQQTRVVRYAQQQPYQPPTTTVSYRPAATVVYHRGIDTPTTVTVPTHSPVASVPAPQIQHISNGFTNLSVSNQLPQQASYRAETQYTTHYQAAPSTSHYATSSYPHSQSYPSPYSPHPPVQQAPPPTYSSPHPNPYAQTTVYEYSQPEPEPSWRQAGKINPTDYGAKEHCPVVKPPVKKRQKPCTFFNTMGCKYGEHCRFLHIRDPSIDQDFSICWDFNTIHGCHNKTCRWEHKPCKRGRAHPHEVNVHCDPKYGIANMQKEKEKELSEKVVVPTPAFATLPLAEKNLDLKSEEDQKQTEL